MAYAVIQCDDGMPYDSTALSGGRASRNTFFRIASQVRLMNTSTTVPKRGNNVSVIMNQEKKNEEHRKRNITVYKSHQYLHCYWEWYSHRK